MNRADKKTWLRRYVRSVKNIDGKADIKKCECIKSEIYRTIQECKDEKYIKLLTLLFLDGLTIESASEKINYSVRNTYRLCNEAVDCLKIRV